MGTRQLTVERTETDVPLSAEVTQGTTGGVSGLTVVVAIRDADTATSYLDFGDNTFKTVGFISRTAALTDLVATAGAGFYAAPAGTLDLTAITNLPAATNHLVAEYDVSGAIAGVMANTILLAANAYSVPSELLDLWRLRGLDASNSAFLAPDVQRVATAGITIDVTGDPATGLTLQRV